MSMDQKLLPAPKHPQKMMFLDEAGYLLGGNDDTLKEDLRKNEGVPNATYLVKDGQVFVFEKLVKKVKEHRKLMPDVPMADLDSQSDSSGDGLAQGSCGAVENRPGALRDGSEHPGGLDDPAPTVQCTAAGYFP